MNLETWPKTTNILLYVGKPTNNVNPKDVLYQGILKYLPNSNIEEKVNLKIQEGNVVKEVSGFFIDEIFTV